MFIGYLNLIFVRRKLRMSTQAIEFSIPLTEGVKICPACEKPIDSEEINITAFYETLGIPSADSSCYKVFGLFHSGCLDQYAKRCEAGLCWIIKESYYEVALLKLLESV